MFPSSTTPFIPTGWLLHCILMRCLCLPSLSTPLPLNAPLPHLVQATPPPVCLLLSRVSFSSAMASCCVVYHQPATLQPPPSIASPMFGCCAFHLLCHLSLLLRGLSSHCVLPPVPPLLGLLSGWLFHCLPLVRLVIVLLLLTLPHPICGRLCLSLRCRLLTRPSPCAINSHTSSPAGCCVASTHATASHLPAPPPPIGPLPLVAP
jgi:hypothetical protein